MAAAVAGALLAGFALAGDRPAAVAPAPTSTDPPPTAPADDDAPADAPSPEATGPAADAEPEPGAAATSPPLEGPRPEGIDEIVAQVAALRGLPVGDPVDARVVSPQALGDKFTELAFADLEPDEVEGDRRLLVALRMLDADVDLLGIVESLFREQILGLYVLEEKIFYVGGDDVALTPYEQITAAHEVTHALQDRAYDLEAMLDLDDREADRALAYSALVEGDAVWVQDLWSAEHQSAETREAAWAEARARTSPSLAGAPPYVAESIIFPYVEGARFVRALLDDGGLAALESAYADPPSSTAEILHPDRYLAGERPVDVEVTTTPGEGWRAGTVATFGEFDLDHLLRPLGDEEARGLADGLAGGEVRGWRRDAEDAVAMALAFRTPEDAAAVCTAVPQWYRATTAGAQEVQGGLAGDGDALAVRCTTTGVQLGIGPDIRVASALAGS